jgi:hypothetical protein
MAVQHFASFADHIEGDGNDYDIIGGADRARDLEGIL